MSIQVAAVASTRVVLRDDPLPGGPANEVTVTAAGGEHAYVHLVLRATERLDQVSLSVDGLHPLPTLPHLAHYVEVTKRTTPTAHLGWYPDAMLPLREAFALDADRNQSVWIQVRVPTEQPSGEYTGEVSVTTGDIEVRVPLTVVVLDVRLPVHSSAKSAFAIWYGQLADYYGLHDDPDAHWATAADFYEFQLQHRVVPTDLPIRWDIPVAEYVARAEPYLADPRVTTFRIPYLADDVEWTRALVAELRARDLLHRTYFYVDEIDEPTPGRHDHVREVCARLDELAPEVPHLVTVEPIPELIGTVRAWVPLFDRYDTAVARERQAAGEQVWWYGCIIPTRPYPTFHLDDDPISARLVSWMQHCYGVDGHLYWATDIFGSYDGSTFGAREVWRDPLAFPGANGDGFLLYPGDDRRPVTTTRLVALYCGLVDYEYLDLLASALAEAAADLGVDDFDPRAALWVWYHRVFDSVTDYTHDADEVEAVHDELGAHLVRLRRGGAVIAVFVPVTGDTFDVELFAPPGTSLTVDGGAPHDVTTHPSHVRARHRLQLPPGRHEVTVASERGVDTYVLLSREDRPAGTRVPLGSRWVTEHGTTSASNGELLFQSKPTGPLPTPGTYLAVGGDWRAYEAVELRVRNVEDRSVGVFVRFHATDGTSHESLNRTLWPAETATIRVPLRHVMVDLGQVAGVEVGLLQFHPTSTIAVSDLTLVGA